MNASLVCGTVVSSHRFHLLSTSYAYDAIRATYPARGRLLGET
jgi:hypothetical protein